MNRLLLIIVCFTNFLHGQHTLSFEDGMTSPKASLENIAWLAGNWKGEAFGGIAEEIWSPPLGGSMMFTFRLVADGVVHFYEFGHILEVDDTLILQLKHFDADLMGWEDKTDTVDFKLVKIEDETFYFDAFSIERISDQEINMYVVIEEDDGSENEVQFNYHRQ